MLIFATTPYFVRFVEILCGLHPHNIAGTVAVKRFTNGEMYAEGIDDINGHDCMVVGSIAPPDDQLLGVLSIADALKSNGAKSVRAFLPYLAYARQDKFNDGQSHGIKLIGSLLQASGIDEVYTLDAHSRRAATLLGLPLHSLSTELLFVDPITRLDWGNYTIVAPDRGALTRCHMLANALDGTAPVTHFEKQRANGVTHLELVGNVGKKVILFDDILDSGRTLVSACTLLKSYGVEEIAIAVSHGLFTRSAWKRLLGLPVKHIYATDSCPAALSQASDTVQVLSIGPLLSELTILLKT